MHFRKICDPMQALNNKIKRINCRITRPRYTLNPWNPFYQIMFLAKKYSWSVSKIHQQTKSRMYDWYYSLACLGILYFLCTLKNIYANTNTLRLTTSSIDVSEDQFLGVHLRYLKCVFWRVVIIFGNFTAAFMRISSVFPLFKMT